MGRKATSKAEAIENAVYDLKAVNPQRSTDAVVKSTEELMEEISSQGLVVTKALERLTDLLRK